MTRTTRAQLARLIEKFHAQTDVEAEFVVTHPHEMDPAKALQIARVNGLPHGKVHYHPGYSLASVSWRALI